MNSKIVFIGGHHNSALIIAKALKKKGHKIYWFGHRHTMRSEQSLSLEFQEIKKAGILFIEIKNMNMACVDLQQALDLGFTDSYGDEVKELIEKYCTK